MANAPMTDYIITKLKFLVISLCFGDYLINRFGDATQPKINEFLELCHKQFYLLYAGKENLAFNWKLSPICILVVLRLVLLSNRETV